MTEPLVPETIRMAGDQRGRSYRAKLAYSGSARTEIDGVFLGIQSVARCHVGRSTNQKLEATKFEL